MGIDSTHPEYAEFENDWRQMRDTYRGQRTVKEANVLYLPATKGQILDGAGTLGSVGEASYQAYLQRSRFPDYVKQAVQTMVGVMHSEAPVIELPPQMEGMRDNATRKGETLKQLLRVINEHQLVYGRYGLLVDWPQDTFEQQRDGMPLPHFVQYLADHIINWDDERRTEMGKADLALVVLNETVQVRGVDGVDTFEWTQERRFRVVFLEADNPILPADFDNPLQYKTFTERDDSRTDTITPLFMGAATDEIPFTFIGSNDLNPSPDEIPLLPLSNLSLTIYQGQADYRQALHLFGQDTLVIIGTRATIGDTDPDSEGAAVRTGAGSVIHIDAGDGADAKYIGIDSEGVPSMASAITADQFEALSMGARLLEPRGTQAESGDALRIRVAAATATLHTVATTGAQGLENGLKQIARWMGLDDSLVKITPNLDFTQDSPDPEGMRAFSEAVINGAPVSDRSFHAWMQKANFTKLTFEEEQKAIENEREARAARLEMAGRGGGDASNANEDRDNRDTPTERTDDEE